MENITAYLMEYTMNWSNITATERWTEEVTTATVSVSVSSSAGTKMEYVTTRFAENTVNRSGLIEQCTNRTTNATLLTDTDMSHFAVHVVWVVLACTFVFLLFIAIVAQTHRCRKKVIRRSVFRESALNSIKVKFTPHSKPGEHPVNPQNPSAFDRPTSNTENDYKISGIKKSLEDDIYEKDSDGGSCQLEISTFTAVNRNYVSKEKLNVDNTTVNATA